MTLLSTFSHALESGEAGEWPSDEQSCKDITALQQHGLVTEDAPARFAICPHCYEQLDVLGSSEAGFYIQCEDGKISIPRNRLRRWRSDVEMLSTFLPSFLGLTEQTRSLIPDHLWFLGRMPGKASGFPVWLLIGADPPHVRSSCNETLLIRSPAERGIILTSSQQAIATRWPRDSTAILLEDVFEIQKGALKIRIEEIWDKAPIDRRKSGKRGRPSKNHLDPFEVFHERVKTGTANKGSLEKEAKAIAAYEASIVGEANARSWGHIRNKIAKDYRCWKSDPKQNNS